MVKAKPEGYTTVTPMLIVDDAAGFLAFLQSAFGAKDRGTMYMPDGKVAHAEVVIGDSIVMVSDANEAFPAQPSALHLYVDDSDAVYNKAVAAGATAVRPVQDQFYGDRSGNVKDRWGNLWDISTHKEDVSEEEIEKRMKAMAPA
jgi:PhnB protein